MKKHLIGACALFVSASLSSAGPGPAALFGDNLVENGDFELFDSTNTVPEGWTVVNRGNAPSAEADSANAASGKNALKVSLPESPGHVVATSAAVPVNPGARYLLSVAFRQEGMNAEGGATYAGVHMTLSLLWLDESQAQIRRSSLSFPYSPTEWNLRDTFIEVPEGASLVKVEISFSNDSERIASGNVPSTIWVDAVQIREYTPPEVSSTGGQVGAPADPQVFFPATDTSWQARAPEFSESVPDESSASGEVLRTLTPGRAGLVAHSPYLPALPTGLYRVFLRMKVPDNMSDQKMGTFDVHAQYAVNRLVKELTPNKFAAAGEWTEVSEDFVVRDNGWWSLRLHTEGQQSWEIDSITVVPITTFSEQDLARIYPGFDEATPGEHRSN